jgi:allantoinase
MGDLPDVHDHHAGRVSYQRFLDSRPDNLELDAISVIIRQLRKQAKVVKKRDQQVRAHVVHLASAEAVPAIKEAREEGLPLSIETTFHYLVASADHVPNTPTPSTEYKCCPPLRSEANRFALWKALEDGVIDYVVSDHSPCTPDLKDGGDDGFMNAWGGISALGLGLSLMWTETGRRNLLKAKGDLTGPEIGLSHIVRWCATKTAEQVGLAGRKGVIAVGADADFVVFDPEATFKVSKDSLLFKNKISPFIGRTLKGKVEQTYLRGNVVYHATVGPVGKRLGELL